LSGCKKSCILLYNYSLIGDPVSYIRKMSLTGLLLFGASVLYAADQSADSLLIFQGDTIHVEAERYKRHQTVNSILARIPLNTFETPASVAVITKPVLEEQNALLLSDALKNISGVNVQYGLGTEDFFMIRGFESKRSGLILKDGLRSPDLSLFGFYGFGQYDLYNIKEVQVLKGPSAFLYGSNTLSGVINQIEKKPQRKNFIDLTALYGKYDNRRATLDGEYAPDGLPLSLRMNALWQESKFYRPHHEAKKVAIQPILRWYIDETSILDIRLEHINADYKPDVGIPLYMPDEKWELPDISPLTSYQTNQDEVSHDSWRSRIDYENRLNNNLSLRNRLYAVGMDGKSLLTLPHVPHRGASGSFTIDRHIYSIEERQKFYGNQLELYLNDELLSVPFMLITGVDMLYSENDAARRISVLDQISYLHPESMINRETEFLLLNVIQTGIVYKNLAPYVVLHSDLPANIKFFLAGRWDLITIDGNRRNNDFDYITKILSSTPERIYRTYSKFNPMIGLSFQDSEQLRFYLNYGRAFAQNTVSVDEPELSRQWEAGYKYQTGNGRFQHTFAIYRIKMEQITIPLTLPLHGNIRAAQGSQLAQGIEFDFGWHINPATDLSLNYAYTQAEYGNYQAETVTHELQSVLQNYTGKIPPFVPAHLLNFWAAHYFLNNFGVGLGVRYNSGQYIHPDNDFALEAVYIWDAALYYRFKQGGWQINWHNFTDEQYYVRGLGPYTVIPATPAMINVSLYLGL